MNYDWYAGIRESALGMIRYQLSRPTGSALDEPDLLVICSRANLKVSELTAIQEGISTFFQTAERDVLLATLEEKVAEARLEAQKYAHLDVEKRA